MEPFAVISGDVNDKPNLEYIATIAKQRYGHYTKAHHEWIDSVEPGKYKTALNTIRIHPTIFKTIQERFPGTTILPVTEADEVYWSASPKEAKGSDRSLVDCHYDAPFAAWPTGGVVYYRVILAVNHNNQVTTVFPDEDKRVMMDTGDFHGLDYNKDWHCVEGSIPKDSYRVLLKMHYLIVPQNTSTFWTTWVRFMNVQWTYLSRITMRMSADPQTPWETFVGFLVNVARYLFNNSYKVLLAVFIVLVVYAVVCYVSGKKGITRTRR